MKAAGVSYDGLTPESIGQRADVFEKAVRKLRGRLMPPPGSRQPDQREIDAFVTWMEAKLDAAAGEPVAGLPGRPHRAGHVQRTDAHRVSRTAVNDLLGIELDAEELLPAEIEVNGFDNIAAALSVSPAFLDQYVAAARLAAKLAVGEPDPRSTSATIALPTGEISRITSTGFRSARAAA